MSKASFELAVYPRLTASLARHRWCVTPPPVHPGLYFTWRAVAEHAHVHRPSPPFTRVTNETASGTSRTQRHSRNACGVRGSQCDSGRAHVEYDLMSVKCPKVHCRHLEICGQNTQGNIEKGGQFIWAHSSSGFELWLLTEHRGGGNLWQRMHFPHGRQEAGEEEGRVGINLKGIPFSTLYSSSVAT